MHFVCKTHQHKARAYINALRRAGYHQTYNVKKAVFLLIDHEWRGLLSGIDNYEYRGQVKIADENNIPVFIYPHSVRPNIPFDLTDDFYPKTRALITIAEGHKEILRRLNYPFPVEVCGWCYTEIKPFTEVIVKNRKINVLFAPMHPVGTGYLPDIDRELNSQTYATLLDLVNFGAINLSVRYTHKLDANGLWEDYRIKFIPAALNGSVEDMKYADVVVSAFTYAHMAVALGKPVIMVGEGVVPHNSPQRNGKLIYAKNWDLYKDYLRYPFNAEDVIGSHIAMSEMIKESLHKNKGVLDWKERFIGKPFDEDYFVKMIQNYVT